MGASFFIFPKGELQSPSFSSSVCNETHISLFISLNSYKKARMYFVQFWKHDDGSFAFFFLIPILTTSRLLVFKGWYYTSSFHPSVYFFFLPPTKFLEVIFAVSVFIFTVTIHIILCWFLYILVLLSFPLPEQIFMKIFVSRFPSRGVHFRCTLRVCVRTAPLPRFIYKRM